VVFSPVNEAKFPCYRLANLRGHAREKEEKGEKRREKEREKKRRELHFPQSITNLSLNPQCFVDVWETVRWHGKQANA
jgi:hypothetical protein